MQWILFILPLFSLSPPSPFSHSQRALPQHKTSQLEIKIGDINQQERPNGFPNIIEQLHDPSWKKREEASAFLLKHLLQARPYLEKALSHPSPEVRWRVREILEFPTERVAFLLAKKIPPSGGYGYYQGQFDDLKKLGSQPVPGLVKILSNPNFLNKILADPTSKYKSYFNKRKRRDYRFYYKIRYLAVLAVGELKLVEAKGELENIYLRGSSTLRSTAACSLAKIGEKKYLNQMLKSITLSIQKSNSNYYRTNQYSELAHLYRNINNFPKTIECYKKALQYSKDRTLYYNLACAFAMANKKKDALQSLQKAVDRGYRDFQWILLDRDLDSIKQMVQFKKIINSIRKKISYFPRKAPVFKFPPGKKFPGKILKFPRKYPIIKSPFRGKNRAHSKKLFDQFLKNFKKYLNRPR